jgi:hypothetical protein
MTQAEPTQTLTDAPGPLATAEDAWAFFGEKLRTERSMFIAIAQQALAARHVAATAADAEDLVHDAVAHLVRHVELETAEIRPDAGILVQEIRNRAQRLHDSHHRRRTDPSPLDDEPISLDPIHRPIPPDRLAIQRALLRDVHGHRHTLHRRVARLAANGKITQQQWEALRAMSRPDPSSSHSPAVRKRASRCRQAVWPVVEDWITELDSTTPARTRESARLTAILEGTGLLQLAWPQLLRQHETACGSGNPEAFS